MKTNHKIIMTLLVIISITALSIISATYSRFVYKQSIQKTITVPEYNHCLANGITNLNDCILVNEANYLSVDAATSAISLKTEPSGKNPIVLPVMNSHSEFGVFAP